MGQEQYRGDTNLQCPALGRRLGGFEAALCSSVGVLRGRATMMTGDAAAADDLVQEAIERALRARHHPPLLEVQPWVLRILKNLVIDRWRATAARKLSPWRDEHSDFCVPEVDVPWWDGITRAQVEHAMRALPTRFREPLQLQIEGVAYAEIARRLGIKHATVGSRIFRGRRLLRQTLETGSNDRDDGDICAG